VNSIILGGCIIKDYCYISNSIIGWNTTVERWARVEAGREKSNPTIIGVGCLLAEGVHVEGCIIMSNKKIYDIYKDVTVL
jgi:mannose-1-phosphate guanylyltransferase